MSFFLFLMAVLIFAYTAQSLFVAPRLVNQWQSQGAQLAAAEQLYVGSSAWVAAYWWLAVLAGVAFIVAGMIVLKLDRDVPSAP